MIEKNKKGNINKLSLEYIDKTKTTKNILSKVIQRQDEIQKVLNYILKELKTNIKRRTKF